MGKIFWFDTETTGLDPHQNDIVQLGYIIEIDKEIAEQGEFLMAPTVPVNDSIKKALSVSGRTVEEVKSYQSARRAIPDLMHIMGKYVNRYDKSDKFVAAGYNVRFDMDFLRQTFMKAGDRYFGSWFHWPTLDVAGAVAEKIIAGQLKHLQNFKLGTLCREYGIPIEEHDALSDIKATRELYYTLLEEE